MYRQVEGQGRRASLQGGFGEDAARVQQEGPLDLLEKRRERRESHLGGFGEDATKGRQEGQRDPLERPRDRQENPLGGFGVDAPQVQREQDLKSPFPKNRKL